MSGIVSFGPRMPGWGSWRWTGLDIQNELGKYFRTMGFEGDAVPVCDVAVFTKFAPPEELADRIVRRAAILYGPVDYYGGPSAIEADATILRRSARILVHCDRLRRYFEPYAPVEYIDHHVKFVAPMREEFRQHGFILWIGVRTNLPPLVEWVNEHPLPYPLWVLTNPEQPGCVPSAVEFGFGPHLDVKIEEWTAERHVELTAEARAAIDIKGTDFRSMHKPPAKGIDFIASGVPLAMNPDSSTVEHLARMGFRIASPLDTDRWLSREYWEETRRFGSALRDVLSLHRVGLRYKRIIEDVLAERRKA